MASDWMSLIRESLEYLEDTPEIDTIGGCLMLDTFRGTISTRLDCIGSDTCIALTNVVHFRKTITCITDGTFCEWQSVARGQKTQGKIYTALKGNSVVILVFQK